MDTAQLELYVLLQTLRARQMRLKGIDATFSSAEFQFQFGELGVCALQSHLKVVTLQRYSLSVCCSMCQLSQISVTLYIN